jgi:hypothetical protein
MSVLAFHIYHWCEIALLFTILAATPLDFTAESAQIDAAQAKIDGIATQLPSTPTPTA